MANSYQEQVTAAEQAVQKIIAAFKPLDEKLLKTIALMRQIPNALTPSGTAEQLDKLTKKIDTLEKQVKKLTQTQGKLTTAKKTLTQATILEKVETQALNAERRLEAQATSDAAGAYSKLIAQQKIEKKALQDLIIRGKKARQTQRQYNKELKNATIRFGQLTAKVNQAKKAVSNFRNTGLGKLVNSVKNLVSSFGIIGGAALFASSIKSAFDLTKKLDSMGFSMRAVIKSNKEFAQTQVFLKQITKDYGAELVVVTNRYIKFRAAADQAGFSAEETQRIFGTFTKTAGVLGLKTDELQGIFLALEQMISKGKITTEELRRQLGERLPGAMDIMAKSMGVTTAGLDALLKKGQVITKDVLPAFAAQVEIAFGLESVKRVDTLQAATTRLQNAWTILVEDFNKGNDASNRLRKVFDALANNLGTIIPLVLKVITAFIAYRITLVAVRLQQALLSKALLDQIRLWVLIQIETIKTTFTLKGLSNVIKTNAIFLLVAIIAGLVIAFKAWSKSIIDTTKEMNKLNSETIKQGEAIALTNKETDELIDKYNELTLKTSLSKEEQQELEKVIRLIGKAFPQAAISVDRYGNALEISTEKTKELMKANDDLNKATAARVLDEQTRALIKLERELDKVNKGQIFSADGLALVIKNGKVWRQTITDNIPSLHELDIKQTETFQKYITNLKETIFQTKKLRDASQEILTPTVDPDPSGMRAKLQEEEQARVDAAIKAGIKVLPKYRKELEKLEDALEDLTKNGYDNLNSVQIQVIQDTRDEIKEKQKLITAITGETFATEKNTKAKKENLIALIGSIVHIQAEINLLEEKRDKLSTTTKQYNDWTVKILEAEAALSKLEATLKGLDFSGLEQEGLDDDDLLKVIEIVFKGGDDIKGIDLDLIKEGLDAFFDAEEKKTEKLKLESDKRQEKLLSDFEQGAEFAVAFTDLASTFFDARIQRYDDEIQKNNDFYAQVLDSQLLSEEQRSAIEAERDRKNSEIEKKKRKEQRKQAIAKKIGALIDVAINTAVSITKTLAETGIFGIPLIPLMIGLGAIQAATIIAQPIPKFAEGKGAYDNYEGVAVWGEKRQEAKISKDGRVEISPKTIGDHLTYVKKDDIIHPNADKLLHQLSLSDIDMKPYLFSHPSYMNNYLMMGDLFVDRMDTQTNRMVDAINKKKMSFKLNQTISLAEDIAFIMSKNDTL